MSFSEFSQCATRKGVSPTLQRIAGGGYYVFLKSRLREQAKLQTPPACIVMFITPCLQLTGSDMLERSLPAHVAYIAQDQFCPCGLATQSVLRRLLVFLSESNGTTAFQLREHMPCSKAGPFPAMAKIASIVDLPIFCSLPSESRA